MLLYTVLSLPSILQENTYPHLTSSSLFVLWKSCWRLIPIPSHFFYLPFQFLLGVNWWKSDNPVKCHFSPLAQTSLVGINWNSSVCSSGCFWFVNADYFLHYFLSRFFKMPKQYIKETYSVFLEHYVSQKIEETYKLWSKQCTKMPCQILHGTRKWQVVRFCFTIFTLWIP